MHGNLDRLTTSLPSQSLKSNMDGLEKFEKALAAEKEARESSERKASEHRHRKHRHRHSHHDADRESSHRDKHSRRKREGGDEPGDGEPKRSRHLRSKGDEQISGRGHGRRSRENVNRIEDSSSVNRPPSSQPIADGSPPQKRDSWMMPPSADDVEHVYRQPPQHRRSISPHPKTPARVPHERELNRQLQEYSDKQVSIESEYAPLPIADYVFGDEGSSWRMTKLQAVYKTANETGRPVEDVALEQYGSLRYFDDAREERQAIEKRKLSKSGAFENEKPTGMLYRERQEAAAEKKPTPVIEQEVLIPNSPSAAGPPTDQTSLNRLRARMMKAKLLRSPNAAQLEQEYKRATTAADASKSSPSDSVVLGAMDSRMLAGRRAEVKPVEKRRGQDRGAVEERTDLSIDEMVSEERRSRGQAGGEAMRQAERIAKDARFDDGLEYMDDNAERLAKRVHKSEINLKNMAVEEFRKMNRILDHCPLCHHEDRGVLPLAPIISLATRVFLTLATEPEVSEGGAVIVPISHRANLLECDDDEWEEIRNFMKSLTRMYHDQGRDVIFYENAAAPNRRLHAAMVAVPIPYEDGATAPAFFKEAFLSSDEEWSQHRKIIDTAAKARDGMGRMAFRRSIAKEMPYFHAWFGLDGGLGHIVEDSNRWPKGDLFAREVIGAIVGAEPHLIKKQGRWSKTDHRLDGWKRGWRRFDWTRILTEG